MVKGEELVTMNLRANGFQRNLGARLPLRTLATRSDEILVIEKTAKESLDGLLVGGAWA
jgi:hypothetical protein